MILQILTGVDSDAVAIKTIIAFIIVYAVAMVFTVFSARHPELRQRDVIKQTFRLAGRKMGLISGVERKQIEGTTQLFLMEENERR